MERKILPLRDLNPHDIQNHGGKAMNLAHLIHLGFNVPNGVTISSQYFMQTLLESQTSYRLIEELDSTENFDEIFSIATALQDLIHKSQIAEELRTFLTAELTEKEIDCGYAVRSSATVEDRSDFSFAGQAETFLCVHTIDEILESVKRVWVSALSPSAVLYLKTKGIPMSQVRMGIIVQEMVDADVSGVMFTVNVVERNLNQILIESTWGLGESLVSGKVVPDSFVLEKKSGRIVSRTLGTKEHTFRYGTKGTIKEETSQEKRNRFTLTAEKLSEIAQIGVEIEEKLGKPQDIEWCLRGNELLVLQTRPITTM